MMMILGNYRFSIDSAAYQTFARSSEYRWEELKRIGKESAMQFLGNGTDTITLEGTIYPLYRGGIGQIEHMRSEAGQGIPLMLISGNGTAFGRWCIVSVTEHQETFLKDGSPRKLTFSITLKKYGEENQNGSKGIVS
jgi:phage protein U